MFKEKTFLKQLDNEQNDRASLAIGVISIFGGDALIVEKILGKATSVISSLDTKAFSKFVDHGFSSGHNADIEVSIEMAAVKTYNTLLSNASKLKIGDNFLFNKINNTQKTITANISEEGVLRSINLYPGVSNTTRITNKINLGKVPW